MIIRGTTPALIFRLPFGADMIEVGYVTVQQNKETIIEKPVSACECDGKTLSAKLTQEDTLKLSSESNAEIKIVVKTTEGERLETLQPFIEKVLETSKDGVI